MFIVLGTVSVQKNETSVAMNKQYVFEENTTFNLNCQTFIPQLSNITWVLPVGVLDSTYFKNMSNLRDRSYITYEVNLRNTMVISSTLTILNASYLDTGLYSCQRALIENPSLFQTYETYYVFVHPPILSSVVIHSETYMDDLLLPTLDVYVLPDSQPGYLEHFRPTHPNVKLFLLKKDTNGRWMEIYSTEWNAPGSKNWSFDKYRGLTIGSVSLNDTNGDYWCDAKLANRITSRYFRIFVTTSVDWAGLDRSQTMNQPIIKDAVEFRIFPTGSEFKLECHIGSRWNVSWTVPPGISIANYNYRCINNGSSKISILTVRNTNYLFSGNYSCYSRTDNSSIIEHKQYVFISDHEKLLLPIALYYILDANHPGSIPCRPSHPDVVMSLEREGLTSRGFENITLFGPSKVNSEWTLNKFHGFWTKNVTSSMAGEKYLCKGQLDRYMQEQDQVFDVFVSNIQLTMIHPHEKEMIVDGDEITIKCTAFNQSIYLEWVSDNRKDMVNNISTTDGAPNRANVTEFGNRLRQNTLQLHWNNITFDANGNYTCRYRDPRLKHKTSETYVIRVIAASPPYVTNTSDTKVSAREGSQVTLFCYENQGAPPSNITWLLGDMEVNTTIYKIETSDGLSKLSFEANSSGRYACRFSNRINSDERVFDVVTAAPFSYAMMGIMVVLTVIALILIAVARLIYVRLNKRHGFKDMQDAARCLEPILAGNPERINPYLPLDEQSELLPYDRRWEFPRNQLKLGQQLGAGCFGRVLLAEATGIVQESVVETVAVKMVRSYANTSALFSLVGELKILIHLGSHVNIVNLLGACTDIINGDFLVIVEYCRFDNLHNYVISNRQSFIEQLDENGELLKDVEDAGPIRASVHPQQGYMMMNVASSSSVPQLSTSNNHNLKILSSINAAVLFRAQAEKSLDPSNQSFSTRDLVCWSFQIARGMDYLSSRNVIHGDLAARNVLLADNSVAKIADFGLSRKVYQDSNYKKKSEGMLPVKWMAIESLTERIFSSQSDVWAFGVLLWELFTLGKAPYSEYEDIAPLIRHLESGSRMEMPQQAPKSIVQIMGICWKADPGSRPSFAQLEQMLGELLEPYIRRFYMDLNEPYVKRNEARSNTTHSGYLLMPDKQSNSHNNTKVVQTTTSSSVSHLDYANLRILDNENRSNKTSSIDRPSCEVTSDYLTMSSPV